VGGHGMGDTTRGRVYRIAPKGNTPSPPQLDLKTNTGVMTALASPNLALRHMAMTKIDKLGLPKALSVLEPAAVQKTNPVLRARALWQLGRLGNLRLIVNAFDDADPRFRILAMRILHDFKGQSPADYIPDWQAKLLKDPSAAVRREALLLLRETEPAKAKDLILNLAATYAAMIVSSSPPSASPSVIMTPNGGRSSWPISPSIFRNGTRKSQGWPGSCGRRGFSRFWKSSCSTPRLRPASAARL
jgi:hypothetical protein